VWLLVDVALDLVESGAPRFERAGATVAEEAEYRLTGQPPNGHRRIEPRPNGFLFARGSPSGGGVYPSRLMQQGEQPAGVQLRVNRTAAARRPEQLRGAYVLHRQRGHPTPTRPDSVFAPHLGAIMGHTDEETAAPPDREWPLLVSLP